MSCDTYQTFTRLFLICVISCVLYLFLADQTTLAIICLLILVIQRGAVLIADVFYDFFTGRTLIRATEIPDDALMAEQA
ncbi:MAG: hypothetical protein HKP40_02465 [Litoreibacter sp.]|nr:hypothetical protein [Litoreibacter sp.]